MNSSLENSRDQALVEAGKAPKQPPEKQATKHQDFSTALPHRFQLHLPRTVSHILHHFPLITCDFLPHNLLEYLFTKKTSFTLTVDDSKESQSSLPVKFSPSLDLAVVATLNAARFSGKVAVLVVPTTSLARKINHTLQSSFGSLCRIATTISSLTDEVSCELFSDARIIISTYNSFLRKLLTKDLPSFQSIIFYHPVNHQNHSLLTAYLFDVMLLRLQFSSRAKNSLQKIFLCDPQYLTIEDYQILTTCSNNFSLGTCQTLSLSPSCPSHDSLYKHAFIPMLGLLFRRHLTRKHLFVEMHSSYLYRKFLASQGADTHNQLAFHSTKECEQSFDKQLYKAFILLSHPSLGPFKFIKRSNNRYTLTSFGQEFFYTVTYSSSSLTDIVNLIEFLCSATRADTLNWDSFLKYLLQSFPVNEAYSYNQSFNQLLAFIQQVRAIYDSLSEADLETLPPKVHTKLSKLLHSRKYSFGDFQNMKFLNCIGQQFDHKSLTKSLQEIDRQMLRSFFSRKPSRKKNVLYNQQKVRELLLTEVLSTNNPQTISQVALALNLNKHLTDRTLRSFARGRDALIVAKTITTPVGRRTLFGLQQSFPAYFDFSCGNCQFYATTGLCTIFTTLGRLAPHKIPAGCRSRVGTTLKSVTVACPYFSSKKLKRESFTLERFGDLTREVQGLTDFGTSFHHNCIYCSSTIEAFGSKYVPQVGTSTISCHHCGSLFKLSRSKKGKSTEKILVKCHEGNLNVFVNTLYDISGMFWDDHKSELAPLHGMTIRVGEKVQLDEEYLLVENIRKKIDELEYLYSSVPLSPEIVSTLKQKGVHVKYNPITIHMQDYAETDYNDSMTTEQFYAMFALRITCLLNNAFLQKNILSRWAVTIRLFLLLEKQLDETALSATQVFDFEWEFLDILLLSSNVHNAYTSRLCEGLAGNLMWLFLKEIFNRKNLTIFSRSRDRYVPEKEFYPNKRTLAFSAISTLTNFFLLLVQDRLKIIHFREGFPWKGSPGLIHGTRKTSVLDILGFFLDFIDSFKIATFYFIAKAVFTGSLGFSDVEEITAPSGATLYAVKMTSISKLESLVDDFFSEEVWYSSRKVSMEEAYVVYLRDFYTCLEQIIESLEREEIIVGGITRSAISWLSGWDKLSYENQESLTNNLQQILSVTLANSHFIPFNYLPVFLLDKFNILTSCLPSLEDFDLYNDWEEQVLKANNIQNFLYPDELFKRCNNGKSE